MAEIKIKYVPTASLKPCEYNPRKRNDEQIKMLTESIEKYGLIDPIICNCATGRENIIIGGEFRWIIAQKLGMQSVPVVYINISDLEKEKELNIRLNKNHGEFDLDILKNFDEKFLGGIGFSKEEIDNIFDIDPTPEQFDLSKALAKAGVEKVSAKTGDIFEIDGSYLMVGDSTNESDMAKLMEGAKVDLCLTDPPYLLDYLRGKTKNKDGVTRGFGAKKNRVYLGTETLPENFTDLWMDNVAKVQKPDFSIMIFEHPKNLRTIWNALEKHWKYRNTIVWHVGNRVQGFSAKYKFFNKHDIALLGTQGKIKLNLADESGIFQSEYENAIFATSGKPHWESYGKGKKYCPTDFIDHVAADEKSSGQGVIFGTKPLDILIPYIKTLTKRGDLILEPFGGSGSTLIASIKMGRLCRIMEKCPEYAEVIKARWEKTIGKKARKIN